MSYRHKHKYHLSDEMQTRGLAGEVVYGRCYCGATARATIKPGIRSMTAIEEEQERKL